MIFSLQAALRAIGNVVSGVAALQDGLRASGILPLLLSMCRSPDDGIKICALQTCGHCMSGNDDVKVRACKDHLVGCLRRFGAGGAAAHGCIGALWSIAELSYADST